MSLWHIAWSYLWNRKLTTCLTILSVALAVALISSVLTIRDETRKRFEEEGQAWDLVVGSTKGSPLQLVLSAVYFMEAPFGNILYSDYEALRDHDYVEGAFPISIGDSYRGYRLIGTVREIFDHKWVNPFSGKERSPFELADGSFFDSREGVVLGSEVARHSGLKMGESFLGSHGLIEMPEGLGAIHDEFSYKVVGILKPSGTPNDRVIFCDLRSVWSVHGHEEEDDDAEHVEDQLEITAVLLDLESSGLRFQFEEYIEDNFNAMATNPIGQVANLFDQILAPAKAILLAVGYLVVVISALSILIGLYLSIIQRKRDLAIMRALGASAPEIFGAVLIEAFWVTVLGIAAGWLLGNFVVIGLGVYLRQRYGLVVGAWTLSTEELGAFGTVAFVGMLAGLAPAWQAYRTDVARDLSDL